MNKLVWFFFGFLVVAGLIALPFWRLNSRANHHAEIVSEALAHSLAESQSRMDERVGGSSGLQDKLAQLNCAGPDKLPSQPVSSDVVYVIDDPQEQFSIRGFTEIEPDESIERRGWRKNWVAERMPDMIRTCEGCDLSRKYSFAIDQWEVKLAVAPRVYYRKSVFTGDDATVRLTNPDAKVDVFLTWSVPKFVERGTYDEIETRGLFNEVVNRTSSDLVAYETIVTFCAYWSDDLTLIARETITTPPPENQSDFPSPPRPETPVDGKSAFNNDKYLAVILLKSLIASE